MPTDAVATAAFKADPITFLATALILPPIGKFGLGMQARDGTLIVSHGNAANTGVDHNFDPALMGQRATAALQIAIQYNRAKAGHGVGGQVFEPEHYRFGGRNSVTFGYRQRGTGAWSWYFVSYTRAQGIYTSFGVQPMVTNAITN